MKPSSTGISALLSIGLIFTPAALNKGEPLLELASANCVQADGIHRFDTLIENIIADIESGALPDRFSVTLRLEQDLRAYDSKNGTTILRECLSFALGMDIEDIPQTSNQSELNDFLVSKGIDREILHDMIITRFPIISTHRDLGVWDFWDNPVLGQLDAQ